MAFADPAAKRAYERSYMAQPEVRARRRVKYQEWAEKNRDRLKLSEARRRIEKRAMVLVATARTRARKRGIMFELDAHIEAIQQRIDRDVCELTGQPFDLSPGRKFNSSSLDRRDPSQGYTYANVRVVLNLVNAALGDWGDEVLRDVMNKWLSS